MAPQRDAQPLALTDGIVSNTFIRPQHSAVLRHKLPGGQFFSRPAPQECIIVPIRHKADILAIRLFCHHQSAFLRYGAYLRLGVLPQRQPQHGQLLLRQVIQHIALVLFGMNGSFQLPAAGRFIVAAAGIVPGRHQVKAQLPELMGKGPKFNISVAADAGVRRAPAQVFLRKGPYHLLPEQVFIIQHIVRNAQLLAHIGRVPHIVGAAAAGFQRGVVPQLKGHTGHLISLLFQQVRRHRAIHSAAHAYHDLPGHRCSLLFGKIKFCLMPGVSGGNAPQWPPPHGPAPSPAAAGRR